MEVLNDPLPEELVQNTRNARGNLATKNARYRQAVCNHLSLRWESIAGAGNCFFSAVTMSLLATLPNSPVCSLGEQRLRAEVVNWLRLQTEQNDNLAERVQAEIDAELGVRSFYYALLQRLTLTSQTPLECSKRGVARVTPKTREEYLDAVAVDRVWIQGYHWPRAVSIIAGVRVGVAIYPFDSIIYYGRGNVTIYLYKADAETHFDALVPQAWPRA